MATERVRLTISVPKEAHEVFTKMAENAGQPVGRIMGDWLQDTIEGAQFVSQKIADARLAPKTVMREMQAMARGLVDSVDEHADGLRRRGWQTGGQGELDLPKLGAPRAAQARTARPGAPVPPSSHTGGKSPDRGRRKP